VGLAKSDPENNEWQRDVAIAHAKLALGYEQGGERSRAIAAFRDGRTIMQRIVARSRDDERWEQDLRWFNERIAALEK
jgi:hypothetical protein